MAQAGLQGEAGAAMEAAVIASIWSERGFTDVERDVWIDAGYLAVRPDQARNASTGGSQQPCFCMRVDGMRAVDWLRGGESVTSVRLDCSAPGSTSRSRGRSTGALPPAHLLYPPLWSTGDRLA